MIRWVLGAIVTITIVSAITFHLFANEYMTQIVGDWGFVLLVLLCAFSLSKRDL